MDRRLNVSLGFNADTKAAKQQIQSLQDQLTALVNSPVGLGEKLTADLVKASHAAAELKVHLKNATNVETGALDFSKLNQSITKSGQSLSSYASQLQKLGPQGQQAFMSLANAVASAEVPLKRSNALLNNFMTTLKNTAKWQLSSSLLHGLQSGVQEAYGYAQDLNESLNNIRIVTGQNIDQMARFAKEANNAAKALSTTTTEYTNASLIYYQQGLSPQEVKERTDLTIKMANVARVSAEAASDQLTAVWNNFADGTKSLEYYVDVMTALGAKTASSTDEIAGGLEKFAGIADTIGLSYEYATSALATLTSNTRQSEEVVGTALKTIFARIQGLNLGETLEDGVTLNKYSQAMKTVGIDILDQQKNLKSMDTLLDELGNKWNTISKAQQTALAQTIAGTRQYTQLVSLMDNWNKGDEDSFLANLATARGSSGALQEQADIYAESWEAARDRVTAAAEKIYTSLFNDEDFIKITNLFADMIDLVGDFTLSIGGLEGVLSGLGLIMTKVFSEQMAQGFRDAAYTVQMKTEAGRKAIQQQKFQVMDDFATAMSRNPASGVAESTAKKVYLQELELQKALIANADKMTEEERERYGILLEQQKSYGQQSIEIAKQLQLKQEQRSESKVDIYSNFLSEGKYAKLTDDPQAALKSISGDLEHVTKSSNAIGTLRAQITALKDDSKITATEVARLDKIFDTLYEGDEGKAIRESFHSITKTLEGMKGSGEEASVVFEKLEGRLGFFTKGSVKGFLSNAGIKEDAANYVELEKILNDYAIACIRAAAEEVKLDQANKNTKKSFTSIKDAIQATKDVTKDWANHLSTMTSSLMSVGMLLSSISGLMDTLEDPNTSGWEKFGSVLTSVSMIAMSLGGVFQGLSAAQSLFKGLTDKNTLATLANAAATVIQSKAKDQSQKETSESAVATKIETEAIKENSREKIVNSVINKESGAKQNIGAADEILPLKDSLHIIQQAFVKLLPTISAVAGAIAITTLTITAASAQWQRFEKDLEKANIAAEHVADSYNEVRTSYDEFSNSTKSYNDIIKSMEDLTEGTLDYNDALIKANEQALQLIENNKELAGKYSIDKGLIRFDEGALEALQQSKLQNVAQSQAASLQSNISVSEAQRALDRNQLGRDINTAQDTGTTLGNSFAVAAAGVLTAALLSVVPGVGQALAVAAVAATVAGIGTAGVVGAGTKKENEALQLIAEQVRTEEARNSIFETDKSFKEYLQKLADANKIEQSLVNGLAKHRTAIEKWVSVENTAIAKEKQDWYTAFAAYNMSNASYNEAASQNYINTESEKLITDDVNASFLAEVQSLSNKELADAYLKEVLKDSDGKYRITNLAGGNVTLEKAVEGGGWEKQGDKNSLSKEQMEQAIANMRAMSYASEKMPEIIDQYNYSAASLVEAGLDAEKDAALTQKILEQYSRDGAIDFDVADLVDVDKIVFAGLEEGLANAIDNARQRLKEGLNQEVLTSDWYQGLTEDNKEFLWSNIEIDKNDAVEEVQAAYEAMQAFLNNNQLTTTIEVADTLISSLKKEGKSKTDWASLKDYYNNTFLSEYSDAMSWDKFMELSQQEQIDYVEAVRSGVIQGSAITNPGAIEKAKDNLRYVSAEYSTDKQIYDHLVSMQNRAKLAYENAQAQQLSYYKGARSAGTLPNGYENYTQYLHDIFGQSTYTGWSLEQINQFLQTEGINETNTPELFSNNKSERKQAIINFLLQKGMSQDTIEGELYNWINNWASGKDWSVNDANTLLNLFISAKEADKLNAKTDIARKRYNTAKQETEQFKLVDGTKSVQEDLNTLRQNYQNALDAQEKLFTEMGLGLDDVNNLADVLSSINKELETNEYLANAVAASMLRYSKGITEAINNYDSWINILENGSDDVQKYQAFLDLQNAYGDILNIDGSKLGLSFLENDANLDLIRRIAAGEEEAYSKLQFNAALAIGGRNLNRRSVAAIAEDQSAAGTIETQNQSEIGTDLALLYTQTYAEEMSKEGATKEAAIAVANNMIRALGYELNEGTFENGKFTGVVSFAKLAEDSGGVLDPEALKKQKQKKNELGEIERYKAINDQLNELADAYEDVSKAADRLYGNDRLKMLDEQNRLLQNEIDLLTEKRKEIADLNDQQQLTGGYLKTDQDALEAGLKGILSDNIAFKYDQNGVLLNYEDLFTQARNEAAGTAEDDPLREQFAEVLQLMDQFDQTREEWLNNENKILEAQYKIQDNNYTKLTEKLNYDLEITNNELQELDYYLSKTEDDFYKMAEAAGYMVGNDGKSGQRGYYEEILDRQQAQIEALKAAYAAGDISEADYVEGLKEAKDAIYEQLEALTGLDKQMLEYYGNTLAAASEEIGKYTEKMDNLNGVLDHYSSLLKLIGKEKNYDMMAEVLQGSVDVLSDSLDVATKEYEFYSAEAQNKEQAYNDAVDANADQSVLDLLKREWEAAEQAQADAQDRMLAKTEQWAEAQKAVIENAMEKAAAALEDALVGKHYSFDFLNEQIDQAVSTQEEYLTTTNKIYETTKLMRTAQQAVDAATNATTKQKLKNFITETQQLQDQTDLSKYELEIQQAKYDLLLAEIALQDAQNAKSMVRLKRDSEGNFGYVYTADDNQVADAQQNLEDAENNLYNIALRGAEDYTTKQIELKQEMQEKLKELTTQFRNGEIQDEEEYNARIASMQEFYISEMEKNARLYGVAIDTDNRVIADSWSTDFADLTTDTAQWTTSVTEYLNESATQLENWKGVMVTVTQTVTGNCADLTGSIGKVTEASEGLRNTLLGSEGKVGVFEEIKSQLTSVSEITQAYKDQREAIEKLILEYETYVKTVKGDITTAITDGENPPPPTTNKPDTNSPAPELKKGAKATLSTNATTWASGANIASYAKGATFEIFAIEGDKVLLGNPSYNPEGGVTGWIKKTDLAGFASGGYTGEWGPSGKLAMLHEKELILNQMDTFNMLTAVDTLHKILEIIDLQSLNASLGGMLSVPGYRDTGSGMLEQNVKIEATFPNVSDHFEIEEAFNTLINQASQYANRK